MLKQHYKDNSLPFNGVGGLWFTLTAVMAACLLLHDPDKILKGSAV